MGSKSRASKAGEHDEPRGLSRPRKPVPPHHALSRFRNNVAISSKSVID